MNIAGLEFYSEVEREGRDVRRFQNPHQDQSIRLETLKPCVLLDCRWDFGGTNVGSFCSDGECLNQSNSPYYKLGLPDFPR